MNTVLLLIITIPAVEIFLMIKIGQNIGALSTIGLIFLTAVIGIYFAKLEGLSALRSGINNLYKNKIPIYEMMSGASIAFAALLLIIPGFITDFFGFLLLIPFTRRKIISLFLKKKRPVAGKKDYMKEKF
jgi:Protein affecting phage T7 exclusion by the F plasmid